MPGVQTLLPLLLDHLSAGRLSLARLVDLTSAGAQRIFGLRDKGRLAVGWHADFTVVDLKKRWTIRNDWIESRAGWTPFDGIDRKSVVWGKQGVGRVDIGGRGGI